MPQCGGCVSKGEAALAAVEGVREASINLATNTATVTLVGEDAERSITQSPFDVRSVFGTSFHPNRYR